MKRLDLDDWLFGGGAVLLGVGLALWQGIPIALTVVGAFLCALSVALAWRGVR